MDLRGYLGICDRGNTRVPDLITIHKSRLDFLQGVPIIDFFPLFKSGDSRKDRWLLKMLKKGGKFVSLRAKMARW